MQIDLSLPSKQGHHLQTQRARISCFVFGRKLQLARGHANLTRRFVRVFAVAGHTEIAELRDVGEERPFGSAFTAKHAHVKVNSETLRH